MQDQIYNSAIGSGFLLNTLRYRKNKKQDVPIDEMKDLSLNDLPYSEDDINDFKTFFKACNLRTEKDELIITMKKTIELRRKIFQNEKTHIFQSFPFYFASPDLVSLARNQCNKCAIIFFCQFACIQVLEDFNMMFPEINAESLSEKWTKIEPNIAELNEPKFDKCIDDVDITINHFLAVYKSLKPQRISFDQAVKSLIIINKVASFLYIILNNFNSVQINIIFIISQDPLSDPMKNLNRSNQYPYIICIGSNAENVHFFIDLLGNLLKVCSEYLCSTSE